MAGYWKVEAGSKIVNNAKPTRSVFSGAKGKECEVGCRRDKAQEKDGWIMTVG